MACGILSLEQIEDLLRLSTASREEFLLFGRAVAEVLRAHSPDKQWTISLEGEGNSGKSLLALAANYFLNPHLYPSGITKDDKIDLLATAKQDGHYRLQDERIYFSDGLFHIDFSDKSNQGDQWQRDLDKHSDIKLFYLSNVWSWTKLRNKSGAPIPADKVAVDMRIAVNSADEKQGDFIRVVNFRSGDNELDKKIRARFQELIKPQPGAPLPRAVKAAKPSSDA